MCGWTRAELAERCGLSEGVIAEIEGGQPDSEGCRSRLITVDEAEILADAFGVPQAALLDHGQISGGVISRGYLRTQEPELVPSSVITYEIQQAASVREGN